MKAVGYKAGLITQDAALEDIELPEPVATGRDILVDVKAVSVNPVDYKVRRSTSPQDGEWKVLGWDAAGIVRAVGAEVTLFNPGDEVAYAGSITRPGTNAELHLVDERIVGRKPASLDWAEAAALPLTSLTAWEALFDRLDVTRPVPRALYLPTQVLNVGHTEAVSAWPAPERRAEDLERPLELGGRDGIPFDQSERGIAVAHGQASPAV